MDQIAQTLSKMFVVLVLLFGSPPPISLLQLRRRPAITLVATAERRDHDPLGIAATPALDPAEAYRRLWGHPHPDPEGDGPVFYPVKAA